MATAWALIGRATRSIRASTVPLASESAPTTSTAVGVHLDSVGSVSVVLRGPAGQTFTGGDLLAWYYFPLLELWIRCPNHDVSMADYIGLEKANIPARVVTSPVGRFMLATSSVTVSGAGTTMTMDYLCANRNGEAL